MKISVILTSYNRDVLLRAAIESVLTQSHQDFELFIMDDDSENPKTHEVLNYYADLYTDVHVYFHRLKGVDRYSRTGYAENINRALRCVTGQAVCYLTCDDIFLPDCLSRCSEHFEKYPDHMVAYGTQRLVRLHPDFSTTFEGLRNPGPEVKVGACILDHNQMMHRIECVKECGAPLWPTDPQYIGMADAVVWQKFTAKGWIAYRLDDQTPTCEHRFHKNSIQAL
jgi:spore maturation protein CgeD